MKTTVQIKTIFGKLLFEFEKENNTIKETLQEAIKQGADLQGAYLQRAYLQGADLQRAYLQGADLQGAYLQRAYLQGAYLQGADLQRAYSYNTLLPEGELIVWKKLKNNLICKLLIPKKAKRVNCIGSRKCRFEFAKVKAIYDGEKSVKEGRGQHDPNLLYKVGEMVYPDKFDDSPLIVCSYGIHAFITRLEAEEYS